jgi:hypothetical protein
VEAWLGTLAEVARLDGQYETFIPGHGAAVAAIGPWAAETAARLQEIRQCVAEAATQTDEPAGIVKACADRLRLTIPNLTIYLLTQTAILACLASLHANGAVRLGVQDNRWRAETAGPALPH